MSKMTALIFELMPVLECFTKPFQPISLYQYIDTTQIKQYSVNIQVLSINILSRRQSKDSYKVIENCPRFQKLHQLMDKTIVKLTWVYALMLLEPVFY